MLRTDSVAFRVEPPISPSYSSFIVIADVLITEQQVKLTISFLYDRAIALNNVLEDEACRRYTTDSHLVIVPSRAVAS